MAVNSSKSYKSKLSQPNPPAVGLAGRSLGALKWNYLGTLTKILSQLVIGIMLARLLGPEPFGLVAIAWLVLGLGNLLADFGLSAALIQKPQISTRDIRHIFTLQMLSGLVLTLIVAGTASWVAAFFWREDAAQVLRWMSLLFLFQSFGQTASAILRRDLNHKRVQMLQVLSYLTSYIAIGIPLALYGAGVWALVCAQLAQSASYALAVYLSVRHSLLPSLKPDQPGLFSFGSKVLLSNLSSWGYLSLDTAIVGRMLGIVDLGLYNRSMNLLASPMYGVVSTLQGVMFPLYSRLTNRTEDVRRMYIASICILAVLVMPAFAAIAAIPDTTIQALYGANWSAATGLVTPLALAMPIYAVLALGGPLMLGLGRAGMEATAQALGLLIMALIVIVAAQISLGAVAWAVLLAYLLRALLVTRLTIGLVGLRGLSVVRALAGPVLLGVLAAAVAGSVDYLMSGQHSVIRLIADIGLAAAVVAVTTWLLGRWVFCIEAKHVIWQARPHIPVVFQALIRQWCEADLNLPQLKRDPR